MIIKDKIYIPYSKTMSNFAEISSLYVYPNSEYYEAKRLGYSVKKIPEFIHTYTLENINKETYFVVPRGSLKKISSILQKCKVPTRFLDERVLNKPIDVHLEHVTLESQQEKIINCLYLNQGGLIEMDPGGGKTIAMLGLIAKVKQPTLVIVNELKLRSQWEEEIKEKLKGNYTLGRYDGEKKVEGDITVAVINSIYNLYQEDKSFFDKFGMVIVDECHHIPATMYTTVLNNISSYYKIGITGTIKRPDGKHTILYDVIGPVLLTINASDLQHRITNFTYKMILTDIRGEIPIRKSRYIKAAEENPIIDYVNLLSFLVDSKERNTVIIENVISSIQEGFLPLVISDRVKHCEYLHSTLQALGFKSQLLTGTVKEKRTWTEIRQDGSIQVFVAQSKIASEGLDLPRLSAIHLTCPTSNKQKIKQQIGRIRRFLEGKPTPCVYDYTDNGMYMYLDPGQKSKVLYSLLRGAKSREKFYKTLISEYYNKSLV